MDKMLSGLKGTFDNLTQVVISLLGLGIGPKFIRRKCSIYWRYSWQYC